VSDFSRDQVGDAEATGPEEGGPMGEADTYHRGTSSRETRAIGTPTVATPT